MFEAFVVALREGSELLLIVLALRELLQQAGQQKLIAWVGTGIAVGLLVAAVVAAAFAGVASNSIPDAILTLVLGLTLSLMSLGSMASSASIRSRAHDALAHQLARPHAGYWIAGFAALAAAREATELVLFVRYAEARHSMEDTLLGVLLGLLSCLVLARAWKWLELRASMLWAFRLSACVLLVIGIQMTIHGGAMLLLSGLFPVDAIRLEPSLEPYLPGGDRNPWLVAFTLFPLAIVWLRRWWRRA